METTVKNAQMQIALIAKKPISVMLVETDSVSMKIPVLLIAQVDSYQLITSVLLAIQDVLHAAMLIKPIVILVILD
jgi:hypothetical protein